MYSCSLPYPLKKTDDLKDFYLFYEYKPDYFLTDGWKIDLYQFRVKYDDEEKKFRPTSNYNETNDTLFILTFIFKKTDSLQNKNRFLDIENVDVFIEDDTIPIRLTKYYEKTYPDMPFYYDNYMDFGKFKITGPLPKHIIVSFDIDIYNITNHEVIIQHHYKTQGKLIK